MKVNKLVFYSVLTLCFTLLKLQAQESVNTSGGLANGKFGSVSYTIGQTIYNNYSDSNTSKIQGVQQPYVISVLSMPEVDNNQNVSISVYPNPVTSHLVLKFKEFNNERYDLKIYDLNGRLLQNNLIDGIETSINMENYDASIYLIKITENNQELKIFKITKN